MRFRHVGVLLTLFLLGPGFGTTQATLPARAPTQKSTNTNAAAAAAMQRKDNTAAVSKLCGGVGQACCVDPGNPLHYCGVGLGCNVAASRCVAQCGGNGQACCAGPDTFAPIGNKSPEGPLVASDGKGNVITVARKQMCEAGACDPTTQVCKACGQREGDACCPPDAQQATASCQRTTAGELISPSRLLLTSRMGQLEESPRLVCQTANPFQPGGTCVACGKLNGLPCPGDECGDGLAAENGRCVACGKIGQPTCTDGCREGGPDRTGMRCVAHYQRPVPPPAKRCTYSPGVPPPTGLILREWMRLGGPSGPMGCPRTAAQFTPDGSTAARYVRFDNGAISISPDKWPYGVWAAYQKDDHFLYDWTTAWNNEDAVNYDKFLVGIIDPQGHGATVDVLEDMEKIPTNLLATIVFKNDTHLRKQGTFDKNIIDLNAACQGVIPCNVTVTLEGCDMPSQVNPFSHSSCRQGVLHPMLVTYVPQAHPVGQFNSIDFSHIPPATSVQTSKGTLEDRIAAIVLRDACQTLPWTIYRNEENYGETALAKLAYADYFQSDFCPGRDIRNRDEVNASIAQLKPESRTGSQQGDDEGLQGIIRTAEYDFALNTLVPMVYKYPHALRPDVLDHVINVLLSKREVPEDEDFNPFPKVPETENHINMIESARYLTNQIFFQRTHDPRYNNQTNGFSQGGQKYASFTDWWLQRLQSYLKKDFIEYNSHPYSRFSTTPLQNLYSYSQDPAVKSAAKMVLDYVSAKIAVSSNDARRSVPYRRKKKYLSDDFFENPDPNMLRSLLLAGTTQLLGDRASTGFEPGLPNCAPGISPCKWWQNLLAPPTFSTEMLSAAMSDYRIPDPILDLIVNPDHRVFYQAFSHYAEELYAGSPSYLFSAGGVSAPYAYTVRVGPVAAGKNDDWGLSVPTTFLPTGAYLDRGKMVRFTADTDSPADNAPLSNGFNLCVAPNFACGRGLQIPPTTYPMALGPCFASAGPWVFFSRSGGCAVPPRGCAAKFIHPSSVVPALAGAGGDVSPNRKVRTNSAINQATQPQSPSPPNQQYICGGIGYYLAVYRGDSNNSWGLLEAYDTYLHQNLTFLQFAALVTKNNPHRFNPNGDTYVTASGQHIDFVATPRSMISKMTPGMAPPFTSFLWGDVMTSNGNGAIRIINPFTHEQATLDDSSKDGRKPLYSAWHGRVPLVNEGPAAAAIQGGQPKTPQATKKAVTMPPPK